MNRIFQYLWVSLIFWGLSACQSPAQQNKKPTQTMQNNNLAIATFGAGCFWCVEAVFQQLKGVVKVESGYSGGDVPDPTYKMVCMGNTNHAEVCQITYDPTQISFEELLEVFWTVHDPTTLNRQGEDIGTQYRSVVFYHTDQQKALTEAWIKKLNSEKVFPNPIVTEVSPFGVFYKAEDYHQNYFNQNGEQPYCRIVVKPKVDKFKKVFHEKLKE
jgi:peptide-methionine (S)-S-oxide reductase